MSSTYLFQNNGLWVQVESALSSTSSITKSATVTETGDHIAMPKVCWYHSPLNDIYVALRQKVRRFTISSGERAVRSGKDGSVRRRSFATFAARSVGTLVKSNTTSKDARVIAGGRVRPAIKVENSAEFLTCDVDLPTSRDRIDTRCFESAYVGELMKEVIGLREIPGLWTLGSSYTRGIWPAVLRKR